ncbi:MAG TPA: hypothetical protein DD733_03065 [Clostridiales bacterium]|nr:hypothetical protein [Clostridiales bacterium]
MIKKKMKNLKKTMEEKKLLIDKQIDKLVQVSKEKTTTEKLREGKYEQYRACERKSEEKFIEEFIAYINSAVE